MRIAYLIVAHNQPAHLFRLIQALDTDETRFYVHVDGKSNLAEFKQFKYSSHVRFIEDRFIVYHAGFSLVRAIINLMKVGLTDPQNQYFITLSGWDYPIKDNLFIHQFLEKNFPTNFINFYPLVGQATSANNLRKFHLIDWIGAAPRLIKFPLKTFQFLSKKQPLNRPFFSGMVPYRGSAWFCLNRQSLEYMIDFLHTAQGKCYLNYFQWTSCADEMIFQTLILNSPFANQCRFYKRDIKNNVIPLLDENKAYLHYIDWDPQRENPAQFTEQDLPNLLQSKALFARKFNEFKSKELLAAIDQIIFQRAGVEGNHSTKPLVIRPEFFLDQKTHLEARSK